MKKIGRLGFYIFSILLLHVLPTYADTTTWTSLTDFESGTYSASSVYQSEGAITLRYVASSSVHTTQNDFDSPELLPNESYVAVSSGGGVMLGTDWMYLQNVMDITWEEMSVFHSLLDTTTGLLYLSTYAGVVVVDTKETKDPIDDTLHHVYNENSAPALGSEGVRSVHIDSVNELIYISTRSDGLFVIDTHGTVSVADDTLVFTYTSTSTPAIASKYTYQAFVDASTNLLYVGTSLGLSVINTQGTVPATDDTLVITYSTSSSPAITQNSVSGTFIDPTTDLLYVSIKRKISAPVASGGLSVIDTHGTVSVADDTLFFTYNKLSAPALVDDDVNDAFIDSATNLLYVSTERGLSVIETQGTATTTDDTAFFTYSDVSSPALADRIVKHAYLDSDTGLLYVSNFGDGLTIIDTQGTKVVGDDTVYSVFDYDSTPNIGNGNTEHAYVDPATDLLYVSESLGGLSVFRTDGTYNSYAGYTHSFKDEYPGVNTMTSMTTSRNASAYGVIGGKIYIAGGTQDWVDQKITEEYDPSLNLWSSKADMSIEHVEPASVVVDGKLYVIGGRDEMSDALDIVEVYDPVLNSWDIKAPMPTPRMSATAAAYNGKIYVFGGSLAYAEDPVDTVEVYDIAQDTWEAGVSIPEVRGRGHRAETIGDKMYILGGLHADFFYDETFTNRVLIFDVSEDSWSYGAYMPALRTEASSVVWNNMILLIGGSDVREVNARSEVFLYDPAINAWYHIFDMPAERRRLASGLVNGDLYLMGGEDTNWDTAGDVYRIASTTMNTLFLKEYPQTFTWTASIPANTEIEMLYSLDGGASYTSLGTTPGTFDVAGEGTYSFKYKALLGTTNETVTPTLESTTFTFGDSATETYALSGQYTSNTTNFGTSHEIASFTASVTNTANTSVTFEYSLDGGSSWNPMTSTYTFPASTESQTFIWRANLSTSDAGETSVITDVSLVHAPVVLESGSSGGGGSSSSRIVSVPTEAETVTAPSVATPLTETSSIDEVSIEELITLLISLDIISPEKADVARTVALESLSGSESTLLFTYPLEYGDSGEDVYQLQVFLNTHGFEIASSGPGSLGEETNYFGELTRDAVMRFQEYYRDDVLTPLGLTEPTGYVGQATYTKMEEIL